MDVLERQKAMAVLARAGAEEIAAGLGKLPAWTRVRGPEVGLVMAQGRAGGGGAAFNLGEVPVTRCTVRLADGAVGHAYVMGREERRAELAAVADAMMAGDPGLAGRLLPALAARQLAAREAVAARAAATKVQFFTLAAMRS